MRPADIHIDPREVAELTGVLIRNQCVNRGDLEPDSGQEHRSVATLRDYLDGAGLELSVVEPHPGRQSLIVRLPGARADGPRLTHLWHCDVVPVNPDYWDHDPWGGELITGEVWGRGAVDILGVLASQAVALRHLARHGLRADGDLVMVAAADEEALGTLGARYLCEHHWDQLDCDYALGEFGGTQLHTGAGHTITVSVAEKGYAQRRLEVRGVPGHGGLPLLTDNALVKAAEVIRRLGQIRPAAHLDDLWTERVRALGLPPDLHAALLDPDQFNDALSTVEPAPARGYCHAATHTSVAVTAAHGGQNANMIPDKVQLTIDARLAPGTSPDQLDALIDQALGELRRDVTITEIGSMSSTRSPIDTPLWDALGRAVRTEYPHAELSPMLLIALTDMRWFRQRGIPGYGVGLLNPDIPAEDLITRVHGHNERIDLESLRLSTRLWLNLTDQFHHSNHTRTPSASPPSDLD
jgi:acetylornithine deacetylase/succinyl-diaminopimelate desuccinylase-like protein